MKKSTILVGSCRATQQNDRRDPHNFTKNDQSLKKMPILSLLKSLKPNVMCLTPLPPPSLNLQFGIYEHGGRQIRYFLQKFVKIISFLVIKSTILVGSGRATQLNDRRDPPQL